jgi:mannitol-specific phosphotransferase system IIBC component
MVASILTAKWWLTPLVCSWKPIAIAGVASGIVVGIVVIAGIAYYLGKNNSSPHAKSQPVDSDLSTRLQISKQEKEAKKADAIFEITKAISSCEASASSFAEAIKEAIKNGFLDQIPKLEKLYEGEKKNIKEHQKMLINLGVVVDKSVKEDNNNDDTDCE